MTVVADGKFATEATQTDVMWRKETYVIVKIWDGAVEGPTQERLRLVRRRRR